MKIGRLLAAFSAICIIVLGMGLTAGAVETSGACGENMTWALEEATGTLRISGTGQMNAGEHPVWYDLRKQVTNVVIEEGVTSISANAFSGFQKLITVSVPASLRTVGKNAFYNCTGLTVLPLHDGVTSIGNYAFYGCSGLTEVKLPSGVAKISYGAFDGCTQLQTLILHGGITSIDDYAFSGCTKLTDVTIPDSVIYLGHSAFNGCWNLSEVRLGSRVEAINNHTFGACNSLTQIQIPDSVKKIEAYAFSNCVNLRSVNIGAGVNEIDTAAFQGCTAISAFQISASNGAFSVDKGVIYNKNKTKLVLMPQGFSGSYTVLSGTTEIGYYSCYECTGLTSLTVPGSVTLIDEYAFGHCKGLKTVTLSQGLTDICGDAFIWCSALTQITIPSTVRTIEWLAFSDCSRLKKIVFTGMAPQIYDSAFSGVQATAYYPTNKPGWTESQDLYGGLLTWAPISCDGNHSSVTDPEKAVSCTESGLSTGSHCAVCGEVITAQKTIPATGHSYGSWVTVTAATEQTEGLSQRTCAACGNREQKTLPLLSQETVGSTEPEQTEPSMTDPAQPAASEPEETENTQGEEVGTESTGPVAEKPDDSDGRLSKGTVVTVLLVVGTLGAAGVAIYFEAKRK